MKKTKVKAIFKGEDGSCGYIFNTEHILLIHHRKSKNVQIEDVYGRRKVEYSSMLSFLDNWDNIRHS